MQRPIARGASAGAGLIFHVFAQDSTSTTGAGKASVAYSSWSCRYIRSGETISGAITPEDISTLGTYAAPTANTNIRIKAVDNTNMIGVYEVQIHADWVNTTNSCQSLTIYLTASGVATLPIQIMLVAYNPQDAVRLGLTALPNAAAEAAGGLYTRGTGAGQINQNANGQVDVNAVAISGDATAADNLETACDGGSYNVGGGAIVAASVTGAVGSVTGSVGSVTGNVGGNVTGSVGSVASGGITAASIADGAIDRATFAADTGLQTIRSNTAQSGASNAITLDTSASATNDYYNGLTIYLTGGTGAGQSRVIYDYVGAAKLASVAPDWTTTPDATTTFALLPGYSVWDEVLSAHLTAGSTGNALNAAGAAGDPWSTALPGAYGAGTAGKIVGDNLNATVGSRLASASYTAPPSAAANADAVWDEARSGHVAAGSFGEGVVVNSIAAAAITAAAIADGALTAAKLATGAITSAKFAAGAIDAAALAADALTGIADALLKRDMSAVTGEASRSLLNAIRFVRNKWSISGTTLTVTKEDDATSAWTATVTASAGADPISAVDPA